MRAAAAAGPAPEHPSLAQMAGIGKSFSGVRVLTGVDFELRAGETHVLAGENGAGKTTLIKILAGVHLDYEGEIRLDGRPVRFRSPHDAANRGIAVIHQEMSFVPDMTVADNIFLGREIARGGLWMDFGAQRARARDLLDRLGLDVSLSEPLGTFPVSTRQMVEIAKALAHEARIIVMDEPTSALNDVEVARLFALIEELKRQGRAIVFISHRMEEIYRVGDRITVLRDGRPAGTGLIGELPSDRLVRMMVGRDLGEQFPPRTGATGPVRLSVRDFGLPDPTGAREWTVRGIGFDLRAGEILGIAGLQGSGKSELLGGLFGGGGRPAAGRIVLDGKPFVPRAPRASIDRGLVLMTNDRQGTGLVPVLDVARNISLASIPAISPGGWVRPGRERAAALADVEALRIRVRSLDQEVRTLSGGNQQKVVLAKWLETRPRVLLLDEPTAGVDVGAKQEIYRLMNRWTDEGLAILLVTSELPELLAMSDRIIVLHRGRVVREFSRAEADQERVVRAAMGETEAT